MSTQKFIPSIPVTLDAYEFTLKGAVVEFSREPERLLAAKQTGQFPPKANIQVSIDAESEDATKLIAKIDEIITESDKEFFVQNKNRKKAENPYTFSEDGKRLKFNFIIANRFAYKNPAEHEGNEFFMIFNEGYKDQYENGDLTYIYNDGEKQSYFPKSEDVVDLNFLLVPSMSTANHKTSLKKVLLSCETIVKNYSYTPQNQAPEYKVKEKVQVGNSVIETKAKTSSKAKATVTGSNDDILITEDDLVE